MADKNVWFVTDRNKDDQKQQAGFPWLLVIQIVLAILSYLIRKTPSLADKRYLSGLAEQIETAFPGISTTEERTNYEHR